jgi:protein-disulfide isomerase
MIHLIKPASKNDRMIGNLESPVVLVEYGDYECPHSAKSLDWLEQLQNEFGDNLCIAYRYFPLLDIHPHSVLACLASEVSGRNGHFWEMHRFLFQNYSNLYWENISEEADRLGIELFLEKMESESVLEKIYEDIESGIESGVTSTPTFFLNNIKIEGPISLEILRKNIKKVLRGEQLMA